MKPKKPNVINITLFTALPGKIATEMVLNFELNTFNENI